MRKIFKILHLVKQFGLLVLEKFFAGLISVGEIVIARKVGRARR